MFSRYEETGSTRNADDATNASPRAPSRRALAPHDARAAHGHVAVGEDDLLEEVGTK